MVLGLPSAYILSNPGAKLKIKIILSAIFLSHLNYLVIFVVGLLGPS